jgi:hypothetical protein
VNIADQIQKLKAAAAVATLVIAAGALFVVGLHFGGPLIGSAVFASLAVGALIGTALTRFNE